MAEFSINLFSNSLKRYTSFKMVIPNDVREDIPREITKYNQRPMKTIFLLHGYTGNAGNWISEELMQKYNFAVVMPNGENAFYLDGLSSGHKYCTFVGEELVGYVRKTFGLAMTADDTYIMGMSMGGFGSLHTALAYPDNFGNAGAMSSALIVHDIAHMKETDENPVANYHYYHECFGDLDKVIESENNPETLICKNKKSGIDNPEMYLCCGTEDFMLNNNRSFHEFLEGENIPHIYRESSGAHDMTFWNEYTVKIIDWMFR